MEVKKSPKADLEGKKSTWYLIGYAIVIALMFVAFEWTERDKVIDISNVLSDLTFEEEIIPITQMEEIKPPPPPEVPAAPEILEVVQDDVVVEDAQIASSEDTGQKVEIKYVQMAVEEEEVEEEKIFEIVEQHPEFPGGMPALLAYLSKNIKYPSISQENGVQGRVTIQFVVNRDGSVVDPVVMRGVDPYLDKEALRVVATLPKFAPGKQRGKPVRVKYTVPVMFRLQ